MKKNFGKKLIATGLAVLTMLSATSMFTASVSAAEINRPSISTTLKDQSAIDKAKARGVIDSLIGKIPVIGEYAKIELAPILDNIFGSTVITFGEKLDKINESIKKMSEKMDENTQQLLKQLYKMDNLNPFNELATKVKSMCELKTIPLQTALKMALNGKDSFKQIYQLTRIFDVVGQSSDTHFLEDVTTMSKYVNGTAIGKNIPLYMAAINVHCNDSVFGGEAAIKNVAYVRSINNLFEYSYALILSSLEAQKMLGENYEKVKTHFEGANDLTSTRIADYAEDCNDNLDLINGYIKKVTDQYNSICNPDNKDSVVSRYNKFVNDNWTSYIKGTNYQDTQKTVDFVKLSDKIITKTTDSLGINRGIGDHSDAKNEAKRLNEIINRSLPLNNELVNLANRMKNDPFYTKDNKKTEKLSFYESLRLLGFTSDIDDQIDKYIKDHKGATVADALNSMRCRFVSGNANYSYEESEVGYLMRYEAKAWYNSINPAQKLSDNIGESTTQYFFYHETTGGGGHGESGDGTNYTLMFFQGK